MAEREKVIKGMECCLEVSGMCWDNPACPYNGQMYEGEGCMSLMMRDALSLLKAQEASAVHVTAEINYRKIGNCPNCGKPINSGDYPNYCGQCGQAVKWE